MNSYSAIELFMEASISHANCIEKGDYKNANRNYSKIIQSVSFLKNENATDELLPLLSSNNIAVRLSAATFLLATHELESKKSLIEIIENQDFHSFRAELVFKEWEKGKLKI